MTGAREGRPALISHHSPELLVSLERRWHNLQRDAYGPAVPIFRREGRAKFSSLERLRHIAGGVVAIRSQVPWGKIEIWGRRVEAIITSALGRKPISPDAN